MDPELTPGVLFRQAKLKDFISSQVFSILFRFLLVAYASQRSFLDKTELQGNECGFWLWGPDDVSEGFLLTCPEATAGSRHNEVSHNGHLDDPRASCCPIRATCYCAGNFSTDIRILIDVKRTTWCNMWVKANVSILHKEKIMIIAIQVL